jgi:hypothetical protein
MKRPELLILFLLLGFFTKAQTNDEAVTNLRHQILDYPQEKLYLQMDRPAYEAGDTIWFRAHTVSEAFHLPSAMSRGIFVNLYGPDNKLIERFTLLPMDKRLYSSFVVLPEEMPEGIYRITAYSEQMQGKRSNSYFTQTFPVKNRIRKYVAPSSGITTPYMVHFYPEGGRLMDKHSCQVAFTVKNALGNPIDVKGTVHESNGAVLTEIHTLQPGIGCFNLQAEADKKYYALINVEGGEPLYVELPLVSPSGFSLKVVDMQDSYYVNAQQAGSEKLSHSLKVLLLLRGVPELTFQLTPEHDFIYIGKAELESGVHEVVLIDENDRVLSQRQIFIHNDDQVHLACNIHNDSLTSNQKKKEIKLDLKLTDAQGQPIAAEFSTSIYPDTFNLRKTVKRNIGAEFLLHTDLSQNLSISDAYFDGSTSNSRVALDAWLIASRWPKFDIQRAIDGDFESSWDIGEKPEESFVRDSTGIYRPLSADEKALRAKYRQIDLNAVNIYPEQLNKVIKPYPYVNHSVKGEDLVTGGSSIQDYLVNLPGVAWDYDKGFLTIRNGSVSYMLDGFNASWEAIAALTTTEIESVDVLKDPGNMGVFKFSTDTSKISNDQQMAIGGVVAVWTKRAIDVKPQANKKKFQPGGPTINDDVRRKLMSGTKDIWLSQFPNMSRANLWKPYLVSDEGGNVQVRFTPASGIKRYVLEINGVGAKGQLLFDQRVIEIPATK